MLRSLNGIGTSTVFVLKVHSSEKAVGPKASMRVARTSRLLAHNTRSSSAVQQDRRKTLAKLITSEKTGTEI